MGCSEVEKEEEERVEERQRVSLCYAVSKAQRITSNQPGFPCRNSAILDTSKCLHIVLRFKMPQSLLYIQSEKRRGITSSFDPVIAPCAAIYLNWYKSLHLYVCNVK